MNTTTKWAISKNPEDILSLAFDAFKESTDRFAHLRESDKNTNINTDAGSPWHFVYSAEHERFTKMMHERYPVKYYSNFGGYIYKIGYKLLPVVGAVTLDDLLPEEYNTGSYTDHYAFSEFRHLILSSGIICILSTLEEKIATKIPDKDIDNE